MKALKLIIATITLAAAIIGCEAPTPPSPDLYTQAVSAPDPAAGLILAQQYLDQAIHAQHPRAIASAHYLIGDLSDNAQDREAAFYHLTLASQYFLQLADTNTHASADYDRAILQIAAGDHHHALTTLTAHLPHLHRIDPHTAHNIHLYIAIIHHHLQDYDASLRHVTAARQYTVHEASLHHANNTALLTHLTQGQTNLARILIRQNEKLFQQYPPSDQDMAIHHVNRAELYLQTHQPAQAIQALEQAIQLDPHYLYAHAMLSHAYQAHGQQQQALDHLTTLITLPGEHREKALAERHRAVLALQAATATQPTITQYLQQHTTTHQQARILALQKQEQLAFQHINQQIETQNLQQAQAELRLYQYTLAAIITALLLGTLTTLAIRYRRRHRRVQQQAQAHAQQIDATTTRLDKILQKQYPQEERLTIPQ